MINFKEAILSGTHIRVNDVVPLSVQMQAEVSRPPIAEYKERLRLDVRFTTMVDASTKDDAPLKAMREALYNHVYGEIEYHLNVIKDRIGAYDAHTAYQLITNLLENMEDTHR